MNTDLKHGLITDQILRVFYDVYNELGHGFLESVYHRSLVLALKSEGLKVCSRVSILVWFRRERVGDFEADVRVENCVLLELKARTHARLVAPRPAYELFKSDRH
jgi:GxxExxY protein